MSLHFLFPDTKFLLYESRCLAALAAFSLLKENVCDPKITPELHVCVRGHSVSFSQENPLALSRSEAKFDSFHMSW